MTGRFFGRQQPVQLPQAARYPALNHREELLGTAPVLPELEQARAVAVLVAALAERGSRAAPGAAAPVALPNEREATSAWAAAHRRRRLGL